MDVEAVVVVAVKPRRVQRVLGRGAVILAVVVVVSIELVLLHRRGRSLCLWLGGDGAIAPSHGDLVPHRSFRAGKRLKRLRVMLPLSPFRRVGRSLADRQGGRSEWRERFREGIARWRARLASADEHKNGDLAHLD